MTIGDRLRSIRASLGYTQTEVAAEFGMGESTWKRLELEDRAPKGDVLARLVALGFSTDWLLTGDGEMRRRSLSGPVNRLLGVEIDRLFPKPAADADGAPGPFSALKPSPSDYVTIPYFDALRAAAGAGALVVSESARSVIFDEAILRRDLGVSARDLAIVPVDGNSMEPTLLTGELVLVDLSEHGRSPVEGAIYVVRYEGGLMVKRLGITGRNQIELLSDSGRPGPKTFRLDEATDFAIIGRVVVVFRKL